MRSKFWILLLSIHCLALTATATESREAPARIATIKRRLCRISQRDAR
jgi:hypothetical protein